jgi:hypothetical protein
MAFSLRLFSRLFIQHWRRGCGMLVVGSFIALNGCGGDVGYELVEQAGGSGGSIFWSTGGTATGGNPFYGSGGYPDDGSGGDVPYDEQDCPYVPPPETVHECDPIDPFADCESYQSCLPYIEYPTREDGCGAPGYGSICLAAGSGTQGDLCSSYGTYCSAGFMCVVGAAGGERCAQICVPGQENNCPTGLICGETDVLGYGVCY